MLYFIALSLAGAEAINTRGLENPDNITKRWGNIIKHPILEQWAIGVEDYDLAWFAQKQLPTVLVSNTATQMIAAGWNLNATPVVTI